MDLFDVLALIGGLSLFLFGMNVMGESLERRAGSKLRGLLKKLTGRKMIGFLTGLAVTAVIQSSSATTVMVVGFVNSGLMNLGQAINVIMGANVGTTVTAWILSLGGIESSNIFVQLLKPTSFTPILGLVGMIFYVFMKNDKKKDEGAILLGFAVLMFGMDAMSAAVEGLKDVPAFQSLFLMFQNPVLGVLAGALLTAIIQSSSASVGILQALAVTGQVTYGAAIPIIMGQNIGTCVTAMLSSVGTNRNARRAALVHLCFNIIGTVVWLIVFSIIKAIFQPVLFNEAASLAGIAVAHSVFNIACTALLLPMSELLEKLAVRLIPEEKKAAQVAELDERLLATPTMALERSHRLAVEMGEVAYQSMMDALSCLHQYDDDKARSIREAEDRTDHYEDILSTYLVRLSSHNLSAVDSMESASLLKLIGDFERVADHSVNLLESAEELRDKQMDFSESAQAELEVIFSAVSESMRLATEAFSENSLEKAMLVEPLEQVVDNLKEQLRLRHIQRMQKGQCSIVAGFIWEDLLTNLERVSDHCSNIAGCLIDSVHNNMNLHESLRITRTDSSEYARKLREYQQKYALAD